ncbi:hypothetical protein ACFXDP_21570, partial [Streptomyces sp. NPDC059374]
SRPPAAARLGSRVGVGGGGGPQTAVTVDADAMGRFSSDAPLTGPFALRLRTGAEVVVTEWTRA